MPEQHLLAQAVRRTLAYMDVFAFPLTMVELHHYLDQAPVTLEGINHVVKRMLAAHSPDIACTAGFLHLPGRAEVVAMRAERAQIAARLWPRAIRYGRLISKLPFVRMVAVTGSLAMNNTAAESDIDFLIVTANDHLWLCRMGVIAVVRLAARRGTELCPNYFLSERALRFPENNLYTAHELVQMVPLSGVDVYRRLRRLNPWTATFLPNAVADLVVTQAGGTSRWQPVWEWPLRTVPGRWLENWEMRRKLIKYNLVGGEMAETNFSADRCKGHFTPHGRRTLNAYQRRLGEYDHG